MHRLVVLETFRTRGEGIMWRARHASVKGDVCQTTWGAPTGKDYRRLNWITFKLFPKAVHPVFATFFSFIILLSYTCVSGGRNCSLPFSNTQGTLSATAISSSLHPAEH
ncbi:hypothetical protein TRVL_09041 [Trypanosoma vivax]|nr:hypothetical protein TRVL_09041 [Trypanosoma vivax]